MNKRYFFKLDNKKNFMIPDNIEVKATTLNEAKAKVNIIMIELIKELNLDDTYLKANFVLQKINEI